MLKMFVFFVAWRRKMNYVFSSIVVRPKQCDGG